MKRIRLLLTTILLAFAMIITACNPIKQEKPEPIQILLDGKPISFEVEPVKINDKAYAEYSTLFKALGYQPEYDSAKKTIKAISPNRTIEISEDGMNAFVDGYHVYTEDDIKKIDGHIMIGVSFVAINSGKKVNWDDKKKKVLLNGIMPEQEATVLNLINTFNTMKDTGDTGAFVNQFTSDTEMNVFELSQQIEKTKAKTTILGTFIDWFSDTEVIILVREHTKKISEGFYPENYSQIRYVLHPENGEWKIYKYSTIDAQFVNPEKLFDEAIEVPVDVKAEIEAAIIAQNKALNSGDAEAYASMNFYTDPAVEQAYIFLLSQMIGQLGHTTIKKWAIVEYTEPNQATVLIENVRKSPTEGTVRKIYSVGMIKLDGQWKFLLNNAVYSLE